MKASIYINQHFRPVLASLVCSSVSFFCAPSYAVNGALPGGYGIKNSSMGGASIALPLDAVAAANNPAGMADVPTSTAANIQIFNGKSSSQYVIPGNNLNNSTTIPSPEGGFNWKYSDRFTFGLSFVGQGAGADYKQSILPLPGADNGKSKLAIIEFIPTVAWKPQPDLSIGFGLNIAYQQFQASGVLARAPVPGGLVAIPTHGKESATGVGARLGVLWHVNSNLSFGANVKSATRMGKLGGYSNDLLAYSDGKIDLPSQFGIGVALKVTDKIAIAADVLKVNYADTKVMQDPNGFQWRNQSVLKLGTSWAVNDSWTVRSGMSFNNGQILASRTVQNLLVPSINRRAFTLGASVMVDPKSEISFGYEINPSTILNGSDASKGTSLKSKVQIFMLGYQKTL
jgi:long-chain fatty acid transport protein